MKAVAPCIALPVNKLPAPTRLVGRRRLKDALREAGPPLLFGLRLWVSVCLALYVAYWLELDSPFWAGTSAALVCQPQLGASLRKGWFRLIGTVIGAVAIVVLTACFPQDRVLFLLSLTLWGAASAFLATILRNFASYAAALAGYTAVIIASDQLGATGGLNGQVFTLAITRLTEIGIGIVCAGIVLAGTDLGGTRRRLALLLADLAAGMMGHFIDTLSLAGPALPDTRPVRRDFVRRVVALDPIIDETIGESSQIRCHSPVLQHAVDGLFAALSGWRAIATHLVLLPDGQAKAEASLVLRCIPPELVSLLEHDDPSRWTDDPTGLCRSCEIAVRGLIALPAHTPSERLLADKAAEALMGISDALNGLALLVADPARPAPRRRGVFQLRVPDCLPALISAARAFITIGAVALFWVITVWPSGAVAMVWAATLVLLFAPRAEQAYASALGFTLGAAIAGVFAAIMAFAVLPNSESFAGFAIAMGLYLVPVGALAAQPWQRTIFTGMAVWFVALLGPTNPMSYDPEQFYNTTLAFIAGFAVAALAFRLMPAPSPAFRTRRFLALTLRDLRRLAMTRNFPDWESHIHGRLEAMPAQATPLRHAQMLAALSLGTEIIRLAPMVSRFGLGAEFDIALAAVAEGRSAIAIARLMRLDEALADIAPAGPAVLRARGSMIVISEVLAQHAEYFDVGGVT